MAYEMKIFVCKNSTGFPCQSLNAYLIELPSCIVSIYSCTSVSLPMFPFVTRDRIYGTFHLLPGKIPRAKNPTEVSIRSDYISSFKFERLWTLSGLMSLCQLQCFLFSAVPVSCWRTCPCTTSAASAPPPPSASRRGRRPKSWRSRATAGVEERGPQGGGCRWGNK